MRAIWRQATRPKLKLSSTASLRGSTRGFTLRGAGFNDFFTVFLAPVFAAATFANLSWKQNQREEWDLKCAKIDEEIALLHQREQEIWARIQSRSIRRGAAAIALQRRSYATNATSPMTQSNSHSEALANVEVSGHPTDYSELNPVPLGDHDPVIQQEHDFSPEEQGGKPEPPPEDAALQRFERLLAYRLALQLLLQVHIGGNPKYADISHPQPFEDPQLPWDVNQMARRLREVTTELAGMDLIPANRLRSRPDLHRRPSPGVDHLNQQLRHLGDQHRAGKINLETLVDRFTTLIMLTTATPNIVTYTSLIHFFNYIRKEDLSYLVATTLWQSSLFLDKTAIHTLLWHYASTRDLTGLDSFLSELTKTNGRVQNPWEWRRVDGILIPVPSTFSATMCTRLIAFALRCDQPHRAHAWATVLMEEAPSHIRICVVIRNFIQYYIHTSSWDKGKLWIAKAILFASSSVDIPANYSNEWVDKEMQVTIWRMLELCIKCGKDHTYSTIFQALTEAGIAPPTLATDREPFRAYPYPRILEDWNQAYQNSPRPAEMLPMNQRIVAFAQRLSSLAEELSRKDLEPLSNQVEFGIVPSKDLASNVQAIANNDIIEAQQALINQLQNEVTLSSQAMAEERRRNAQHRHQDVRAVALLQQQIEALQQERSKSDSTKTEPETDHGHEAEKLVAQQGATIRAMQAQIAQLMELVSRAPTQVHPTNTDQKHSDVDSGYGSDSASESDAAPSWESSPEQTPSSDVSLAGSRNFSEAIEKSYFFKRFSRKDFQARDPPPPADQQAQPQAHRSMAPYRSIRLDPPSESAAIDFSNLQKSQRLLLTSLTDWLQWHGVANGRTGSLRHRPFSDISLLTHHDLIDMGIADQETRNFMLKDIKSVRRLSPEVLEKMIQTAKSVNGRSNTDTTSAESNDPIPSSSQSTESNDSTSTSTSTTTATASPNHPSSPTPHHPPVTTTPSWNISSLQDSFHEINSSWHDTATIFDEPRERRASKGRKEQPSDLDAGLEDVDLASVAIEAKK